MSYTKRKLMGLLTLGTATLGTVSSGVTSAGWLDGVKNFFSPTTQTKEMKNQSEKVIDASRGYGAAINLANIVSEHNKEGVINLLGKEFNIFSESEGNKNLSEDQLLEKGNELLKIAHDLGIENEEISGAFEKVDGYKSPKKMKTNQNNCENTINLYDEGAWKANQNSFSEDFEQQENNKNEKNKIVDVPTINIFNLYLLKSGCLSFEEGSIKKDFFFNINYHAVNNKNNIKAVQGVLLSLRKKIFEKLKNAKGDTLKNGISSIMQVICEEKKDDGNYFKGIINKLMSIEVKDENGEKEVKFKDSIQFKELIRTIEKKEGNLKDEELSKDTKKGKNKLDAVKEMIKFRDNGGVLFEVLDSLGYTRSALGRFFDNKYVRVALGVGAAVGVAYVAGIPLLSIGFAKVAVGCLAATKLLDLRHQDFGAWAWSNIKSAVKTTTTIVKGVGSIIGKGMTIFEGYKW